MLSEPPTAEQRKADAEADSAELDLDKKRLELEECKAERTAREVEATASMRTAAKDMTPDLSGVDRGSTTLPESGTIFQALLGGHSRTPRARWPARSRRPAVTTTGCSRPRTWTWPPGTLAT